MDLQIIKETNMPLLSRKVVEIEVGFTESKTPSNSQLKEAVAKLLKADPKLVVIKHIQQRFGTASAKIFAYVYTDESTMKSLEKESKVKYEEAKKDEGKKEEKKEESGEAIPEASEKKEEVKEETKKGGEESGKEAGKE